MKEIISFLTDLNNNNTREWFQANKQRYVEVQARFNKIVEEIILGISEFDPSVSGLTAKDCTYRIYRDVRFSKDKSPYKTHMGAYICPGGKKSGYSGYYFHVGIGGKGYPYSHMLASGDYICDPKVLTVLREDIAYGEGDFEEILMKKVSPQFWLDEENSLKKMPKGFESETKYGRYLKLRNYCLCYEPDNDFMLSEDMSKQTVELFRTTLPFLDYINRAVRYVKEN